MEHSPVPRSRAARRCSIHGNDHNALATALCVKLSTTKEHRQPQGESPNGAQSSVR